MSELFVAIRCEELPARFIDRAAADLAAGLTKLLKGIEHGEVRTWSTPRRLAVAISGVAEGRSVEELLVTGPPERAAFRDGQPTKAAIGFARGKGVAVADLEIVQTPRGPVVGARIQRGGEKTAEVVAAGLEKMILAIAFEKAMRWGKGTHRWVRPIHGVIALLGGQRIDTTVAGVRTSTTTLGHRLTPGPVAVTDAESWLRGLRAHNVEPSPALRRQRITDQLHASAAALGAAVHSLALLDEVVNLVEWPVTVTASFGEDLLQLPHRLLVESMGVHQRVFPLTRSGRLDHHFLTVSNQPFATEPDVAATIAEGNKRVLTARFYDARFFYAEDRRHPLASYRSGLEGMQWIRKGGTMAQKTDRIAALAESLAPLLGADRATAARAGALSKCDLATQMVGEFPKLQGHVGRLLAGFDGEDASVAVAIEEHYLPRYTADTLPATPAGRAVACADRLDTLTGCFSLGLKPKGSADPLGLRRAAIGLLQIVLDAEIRVDLPALIHTAGLEGDRAGELLSFLRARLRGIFLESAPTNVVNAVLATQSADPVALQARIQAVTALSSTPEFEPLKTTFKRVMGLTRDHLSPHYAAEELVEPAEQALHAAWVAAAQTARAHTDALRYADALAALSALKAPVDRMFDEVLVMCEDETVRANRLGLLRAIADEFRCIVDFTQL